MSDTLGKQYNKTVKLVVNPTNNNPAELTLQVDVGNSSIIDLSTLGGGTTSNSFATINPSAGTKPVASSSTDTLNFTSSDSSVSITGNSSTKTLDFKAASGSGNVSGPATSHTRAIATYSDTTGKVLLDNTNATIDSSGNITGASFIGPLTGSVTGNVSGSSGSCTGNAATATTASSASTASSANSVSGTNVVGNTNLSQMSANTIKGNNTGSAANAADLTVAQVNAILPVFTSSLNGLTPSSGGGSANFLRADGTWVGCAVTNPSSTSVNTLQGASASVTPLTLQQKAGSTTTGPITWGTNSGANVSVSGSTVTRVAASGWDGGALGNTQITSLIDGYIEWTEVDVTKLHVGGLSNTSGAWSYLSVNFGIYNDNGVGQIYEFGSNVSAFATIANNDVLRVSCVGGIVKYYLNGVLKYTSLNTPTFPLYGMVSEYTQNGTFNPTYSTSAGTQTVDLMDFTDVNGTVLSSISRTGNFVGNVTGNVTGNVSGSSGSCTGNATTATSFSGSLSGDVAGTQGATVVGKINGTSLASLGTGILKNTTTTGVPSIAIAADFPTLNQNTTGSAATLTTPRAINGTNFDGSGAITVTAAASTLTGTTLNATVVASSLTSVGTITTGVWSGTTILATKGGTGVTSVTTTPAATAFAGWDANKNLKANNFIDSFTTTATAAGTTALLVGSTYYQAFTGTTTQTVTLPVATTLSNGQGFWITNASSGVVTVNTSGANLVKAMAANSILQIWCINTAGGTGTASWNWLYTASLNN